MFVIGNEELKGKPALKEGMGIECPHCHGLHTVECGKDGNGKKTSLILYYKCGEKTFLAGIDGKSLL